MAFVSKTDIKLQEHNNNSNVKSSIAAHVQTRPKAGACDAGWSVVGADGAATGAGGAGGGKAMAGADWTVVVVG